MASCGYCEALLTKFSYACDTCGVNQFYCSARCKRIVEKKNLHKCIDKPGICAGTSAGTSYDLLRVVELKENYRGVIARQFIPKGTFLSEDACFHCDGFTYTDGYPISDYTAMAYFLLSTPEKVEYQALLGHFKGRMIDMTIEENIRDREFLSSRFPTKDIEGIMDLMATNRMKKFSLVHDKDTGEIPKWGLFWIFSMMNHSCRPNLKASEPPITDGSFHTKTFETLHDILVGEELTWDYLAIHHVELSELMLSNPQLQELYESTEKDTYLEKKQNLLFDRFKFRCNCKLHNL